MACIAPLSLAVHGSATLAQTGGDTGRTAMEVLWNVALIIVAVAVVIVVALVARRWLLGSSSEKTELEGFTLADMRAMHERGELSDEEWQATRQALLSRGRQALHSEAEADSAAQTGTTSPASDEAGPPNADDDERADTDTDSEPSDGDDNPPRQS